MKTDDDIMTAEEFFSETENQGQTPLRKRRARGKKKSQDLFAEVKVKMVMRVYGVSRAKALEIISARAEDGKAKDERKEDCQQDEEVLMSAADFFGA